MKKLLLFVLITFLSVSTQSQNVNIPDAAFKSALVNDSSINTNNDTEIQVSEATAYTGSIDVGSLGITDMTGIEAFTNITTLSCGFNNLTTLDISHNTALTGLWCLGNQITSLTLNSTIEILDCADNQLTNLNVSQCPNLKTLQCGVNQLTSIDTSQNTLLDWLAFDVNQITSIDITTNTLLTIFQGNDNQLTSANLKNGNNTTITNFTITNNPNLTCIEVDDVTWSNSNWTSKDTAASYSTNCHYNETYVPNNNFEQALIDLGYDTVLDDYVLTDNIKNVSSLDLSYKSITDLTGIEDFTALTTLDCNTNQLTSLDITNNILLTELNCEANQLTSLDIVNNTALTTLRFGYNQITSIDLSQNTSLTYLNGYYGTLNSIDVSQNPNLTYLNLGQNNLTSIDISLNVLLTAVYLGANQIDNLNTSNNIGLLILRCNSNQLTSVDVTTNTSLVELDFSNNLLSSINISLNTSLEDLSLDNNLFTTINISSNTLLKSLNIDNNLITSIDISQHPSITYFNSKFNDLTSANLKNGNNSNFTYFDIRYNTNLTCIEVDDVAWSNSHWLNKDATASYSTNCGTASVDEFLRNKFQITPNPVVNNLQIKSDLKIEKIYIYNLLGELLLEKEKTNTVNLSGISKGIYLVKIESEKGIALLKLIKE